MSGSPVGLTLEQFRALHYWAIVGVREDRRLVALHGNDPVGRDAAARLAAAEVIGRALARAFAPEPMDSTHPDYFVVRAKSERDALLPPAALAGNPGAARGGSSSAGMRPSASTAQPPCITPTPGGGGCVGDLSERIQEVAP
jgi:hypothetical protein